jgi:hypothetical protein
MKIETTIVTRAEISAATSSFSRNSILSFMSSRVFQASC